jgi:hypothetical protein
MPDAEVKAEPAPPTIRERLAANLAAMRNTAGMFHTGAFTELTKVLNDMADDFEGRIAAVEAQVKPIA